MKSILIGLTLTLWILSFSAYTQTDDISNEVYCLPMGKARLLVADALRLRVADSLNMNLSSRIVLLESQYESSYQSFTNLLKIEREKQQLRSELFLHMESVAGTYKSENETLKKKIKRLKLQRAGLGVLTVVVIVLSL